MIFLNPAPNSTYGEREDGRVLMFIVHHTVSLTLKNTRDALNARGLSVHFIVDRDGSITLMVPLEKAARHAGFSYAKVQINNKVEELQKLNNYSVGMEIVNTGIEPFPEKQIKSIKEVILYTMKRFKIKRDMVFSHSEIGCIVYNKALQGYVMRKPDPHKLFDWEFLERNGIGLHIGHRIHPEEAKRLMNQVLYKADDKNENILKLKQRLNRFFYKILPWDDKDGKVIFPDNNASYSNEFDQNFVWVVYQFSIHHLPKEIRKDLPLKLEQEDILPEFLSKYGGNIFNYFTLLSGKIESNLKPPHLNEADYGQLLSSIARCEENISLNAFSDLMCKIGIYYHSYLRYEINGSLYLSFKLNALAWLDVLKGEILHLKSLDSSKVAEVSSLIGGFKETISNEFNDFEKQWFQEFKNTWKQKFLHILKEQITWTALHEAVLVYLEGAKKEMN